MNFALNIKISHRSKSLIIVLLYIGIALLIPGYGWQVRAELIPAVILSTAIVIWLSEPKTIYGDRFSTICGFLFINLVSGLLVVFTYKWSRNDGLPFILSGRESFLTYLTAYNVKDISSLIIQDISIGGSKESSPFWYLNHPNLTSKLLSLGGQILGLGLEEQILLTMCVSIIGFLFAFLALRKYLSSVFALAFVAILALNVTAFLPKSFDLLWGINNTIFWVLLFFLFGDERLDKLKTRIGLPLMMFLLSLSDWGFFVFVFSFVTIWLITRTSRVRLAHYGAFVLAPALVGLLLYSLTIVNTVGMEAFKKNISTNLTSRLGQHNPSGHEKIQLEVKISDVEWLQKHNIAVLPRPATITPVTAFFQTYVEANKYSFGRLGPLTFIFGLIAVLHFLLARVNVISFFWLLGLIGIITVFNSAPPFLLLIPIAILIAVPLVIRPHKRHGKESAIGNLNLPGSINPFAFQKISEQRILNEASSLVAIIFISLLTSFAILPSYISNNILNLAGLNLPGVLSGAVVIGTLTHFLVTYAYKMYRINLIFKTRAQAQFLASKYFSKNDNNIFFATIISILIVTLLIFERIEGMSVAYRVLAYSGEIFLAMSLIKPKLMNLILKNLRLDVFRNMVWLMVSFASLSIIFGSYLRHQYNFYKNNVTTAYPFAKVLKREDFQGASFITNNDEAATWYFTKGWSYSISNGLPGNKNYSSQMYFGDMENSDKYSRPDFYLCDDSRFVASVNRVVDIEGYGFKDCNDVAAFLEKDRGFSVVKKDKDFSIVRLN